VIPIGRFFGRITQKGPSKNVSGRTNLRQNCGRIFPEMLEKKAEYLKCLIFCIFPMWNTKKPGIFIDFGTSMVSKIWSHFDEME